MKISSRILSLVLALVMVLSVVPMMFMTASAAEAATQSANTVTGTPGTAPTTLPNGKTYAGTPFIRDNWDLLATLQKDQKVANWVGSNLGTGVQAMFQDGAEGIMFKIDTTNAAETTQDYLAMTMALQIMWEGQSKNTYIIPTPKHAVAFGEATTTAADTSSWYYSQDGATWNELVSTGTTSSYVNIPVGKGVTYVYIPMTSFWTKCGETYLTTGTHDKTENIVNWMDAKEMIKDDYWINAQNYYFSGNYTTTVTYAQDPGVKISEWRMVDHVQSVYDMATSPVFKDGVPARPSWTGGSWYLDSAENSFAAAKGLMVEVDATGVAATEADPTFAIMMSGNRADGTCNNAYLLSTFGQANAFGSAYAKNGSGTYAKDQSSISYWSEDGKTWVALTGSGSHNSVPAAGKKGYLYIPFESFWTRYAEKDLSGGVSTNEARVDKNDYVAAMGEGFQFNYIHVYFGSNAASNATQLSNWKFVYAEGTQKSDKAPITLPDGGYYTAQKYFNNDSFAINKAQSAAWSGGNTSYAADFTDAEGIMFKVDAAGWAGTDLYGTWFAIAVAGNNGRSTYLISNAGAANAFGECAAVGKTSTWYYSEDGVTWNATTSAASTMPISAYRGDIYVYVPYSEMYTKCGATYLTTGTHDKTEPGVPFAEAAELVGGWKNSFGGIRFLSNSAAYATEFRVIYKSETAPVVGEAPELPNVNSDRVSPMLIYDIARPSWVSQGYFTATALESFKTADGVMFQLDTTACTGTDPLQMSFFLSVEPGHLGGNNYFWATAGRARDYGNAKFDSSMSSTWYWSEDGEHWEAYTADYQTNKMTLNSKKTVAYVYVPFTSFWSRYNESYIKGETAAYDNTQPSISYADYVKAVGDDAKMAYLNIWWGADSPTGNAATAVTKNWSFVHMGEDKVAGETAPSTLPGSDKPYYSFPLLTDGYDVITYDERGVWPADITNAGAAEAFKKADGIMVTLDTSNSPLDASKAGFVFSINVKDQYGRYTYIVSNYGQNRAYADTAEVPGATSTWYVSDDGVTWVPVVDDGSTRGGFGLSAYRGKIYVYIPKDAMYVRYGETQLLGGAKDTSDPALTLAEATALVGDFVDFDQMAVWFHNGNANTKMEISDWKIVGETAGIFTAASVTLTNNLAMNLYANLPANATNVSAMFTMAGKTYRVGGVAQANGQTKFTFANILPQQMGETITATLTATIDGKEVTDTYVGSVESYARAMLSVSTYSHWHEMLKALLHYGAAVQTAAGQTATVSKNVAAPIYTLDLTRASTVYVNGDPSVFTSAAMSLDSTIMLKVGVKTADAKVKYTVGSRSGMVDVVDGYAYVPVYAYEVFETVTLQCISGGATLKISAAYYLKNAINDNNAALLQAVANYMYEASAVKGNTANVKKPAHTTLAQISLTGKSGGLANVIQLTDGSYIVIDGGTAEACDAARLWNYLYENSGYTKPVVRAWILTHLDGDHTYNAFNFILNLRGRIDVQMLAYSDPTDVMYLFEDAAGDSEETLEYKASTRGNYTAQMESIRKIREALPELKIWDMQAGETAMIGEVKVDVLYDASVVTGSGRTFNDISSIFKLTFTQGTDDAADDKTYMVLGDSTQHRTAALADDFSSSVLKSDVMQAAHHGLYGGDKSTYQVIAPKISLVSSLYNYVQSHGSAVFLADYNVWMRANSTCYYADHTQVIDMSNLAVTAWD